MDTDTSPARQLVDLIWEHANKDSARGHSWTYLNQSLYMAVRLAIFAGLKFAPDDFNLFATQLRSHYWVGVDNTHNTGEGLYSHAVENNNISACIAFEAWKARKPFKWDGKRLCIGSQPLIDNCRWRITSFDPEGHYFTAVKSLSEKRSIRRFSHNDLKEMRAARKASLTPQPETLN